jgi:hypothetical protein
MSTDVMLSSPVYRVTGVFKKTRARLFSDVKIGDCIRITFPLRYAGQASRGSYATRVTVENVTQGTSLRLYISAVVDHLACFGFEVAE